MHIVNKLAIAQALVAGVDIRALLATYDMPLDLIFRYSVNKVFYFNANKMQHLGQTILVYCLAQAFLLVLTFEILIKDRDAFQHK